MNKINEIFDLLDKWRHFPSYQLERRADIFFALYMEDILEIKEIRNIDAIIPEFPVRVNDGDDTTFNTSYKIDYLIIQKEQKVTLLELKTDMNSFDPDQYNHLLKHKEDDFNKRLYGLISIYNATKAKNKYRVLLDKLANNGFLTKHNNEYSVVEQSYVVDILYILPINEDNYDHVITFHEIAEKLKDKDETANRFSKSLIKWADIKAGE